jgi:hypothetical protein
MQSLSAIFVCAAVMFAGSVVTSAEINPKEEAAVRGVVSNFAESWNRPGMPGFSDLFTDDADFVVITGKWLKGRTEIVSYHKNLLETLQRQPLGPGRCYGPVFAAGCRGRACRVGSVLHEGWH